MEILSSGRELFAFEANVGGDDEEAEDIVIEKEVFFLKIKKKDLFFKEPFFQTFSNLKRTKLKINLGGRR